MRNAIVFFLNGQRHEVTGEHAGWMLADYLRYVKRLTGTKIVCAEGDCGACTVLRYFPHPILKGKGAPQSFLSVNSCITTVAQMDGSCLVTVDAMAKEGIATHLPPKQKNAPSKSTTVALKSNVVEGQQQTLPSTQGAPSLSPVQKAMMNCHGSQCGFCTPGFVMALAGLVEHKLEKQDPTPIGKQEAKNALTGNLCRCTGYEPILDAALSINVSECDSVKERFWSPAIDRELRKTLTTSVGFASPAFSFYAPKTLREAIAFLKKRKNVRLLAAGTDLGVVHNKRKLRLENTMSLHLIPELYEIRAPKKGRIRVGARVTLTELRSAVKETVPEFARFLDLFASPQIKNVATLVGNVCNGSPIADTPPFLLASDAVLHVIGPKGKRPIRIEEFYLGYRRTALKPGEVVIAIEFEEPAGNESLNLYKVSQRKDLDISTVNAAFKVRWKDEGRQVIQDVRIALGGVAAIPVRMKKTEKALMKSSLDASVMAQAVKIFQSEMTPISDLRGTSAFRRVAAENLFHRFFREHTLAVRLEAPSEDLS